MDEIVLELGGAPGTISADAVHDSLGDLLTIAKEASNVTGSTAGTWTIERLAIGSAVMAIANPAAAGVPAFIEHGLAALREKSEIPLGWTIRMVKATRKLSRLPGHRGVTRADMTVLETKHALDVYIANATDQALRTTDVALGTVMGKIDVWTSRDRRTSGMTLTDGSTIQVTWPDQLEDWVKQHLDRSVQAFGTIERNAAGQRIKIHLEDVVLAEDAPQRVVPVSEVVGIYADVFKDYTLSDVMGTIRQ